jgi:hypothetical protein
MPLIKNTIPLAREERPNPISFRFSGQSVKELKILSEFFRLKQTQVLAILIHDAYEATKSTQSRGIREAEDIVQELARATRKRKAKG